jgi:hypothetical protein
MSYQEKLFDLEILNKNIFNILLNFNNYENKTLRLKMWPGYTVG